MEMIKHFFCTILLLISFFTLSGQETDSLQEDRTLTLDEVNKMIKIESQLEILCSEAFDLAIDSIYKDIDFWQLLIDDSSCMEDSVEISIDSVEFEFLLNGTNRIRIVQTSNDSYTKASRFFIDKGLSLPNNEIHSIVVYLYVRRDGEFIRRNCFYFNSDLDIINTKTEKL